MPTKRTSGFVRFGFPLTALQKSGRTEGEIVAEIQRHKGIPNGITLAAKLRVKLHLMQSMLTGNSAIRTAFEAKVVEEAKKLSLGKLLEPSVSVVIHRVPEAIKHRDSLALQLIASFQGVPTVENLFEHILPRRGRSVVDLFKRNPHLNKAAEKRLIELLDAMTPGEIVRRKLHISVRSSGRKALKGFLEDKLAR